MPSSLLRVNALAVTIRPPLPKRAKAVIPRSISLGSRTLTGLTSTPSDGAADWMAPNMPIPAVISGIANDRRSRHGRRDLLEKLQPFSGDAIFELSKTGGVAARLGQAADQARSDRVGGVDEHHGDGLGDLQQRCCGLAASGEDNVRGESHQFGRVSARSLTYPSPTIFDADVAPDVPAGLLRALQERSVADLRKRSSAASDAITPMLRPRRNRPRSRRAAEQRNELAPPHVGHRPSPPVALPVGPSLIPP